MATYILLLGKVISPVDCLVNLLAVREETLDIYVQEVESSQSEKVETPSS
jgi:hypothetical protein